MSHNMKEARPVGDATGRAETGAETRRDTTSISQSTTTAGSRQIQIADFLGRGESEGILLRDLKELVHSPGRAVRKMIQAERLQGVAILSDNIHGYYLPGNSQELKRFVRSMRGRAAEIEAVADAVEKAVVD